MKKILCVLLSVFFLSTLFVACTPSKPNVLIGSMGTEKNWNNYAGYNNKIDVTDTYVAHLTSSIFSSKITMWNRDGAAKIITEAEPGFCIDGDFLYYKDEKKLYRFNYLTEEKELLSDDVSDFFVQDEVLYIQTLRLNEEDPELDGYRLHKRDLSTDEEILVAKDSFKFWVHNDVLYHTEGFPDDILYLKNPAGDALGTVDFPILELFSHTLYFWQGKAVSCWDKDLILTDFKDKTQTEVELFQDYEDGTGRLVYAVSDEMFFFSWQSLEYYGSFIFDIDNEEHNGLWYVEPETYEQRKVCDLVFDSLFMTDDYLFGTVENDLYAVNLETFEVQEVN